jgi:histidinol-phosphatase (PHP family)
VTVDFHAHCEYSIDAQGTVSEYVERALGAGLSHVCFTTHCDLDPARLEQDGRVNLKGTVVDVNSAWLESYIEDVWHARASCAGRGLEVLCGLEIGYVVGIERMVERTTALHGFDFVLCGVHTLAGTDIVSAGESSTYFARRSPRQVCEDYFACLREAVACDLFDSVAHLDIYKRCGLAFYGDELLRAHAGLAEPVLEAMAKKGLCLEINSAGFRRGLRAPYPSVDLLRAARAAGVRDITLGSDCHRPEDVGQGVDLCARAAREAGFDRVTVFEARRRRSMALEDLQ